MFLVDTNVLSAMRKPERAGPAFSQWAHSVLHTSLFVSSVTLLELEVGVLLMERRDEAQGRQLRAWMNGRILPQFIGRTIALDTRSALRAAALHVPDPRPERDAMIAATALVHDLTVATRNTKHFLSTGVRIFDPWQST